MTKTIRRRNDSIYTNGHGLFHWKSFTFFARLKKDDINMILGRQLLRSATSIGANYAEADHARSKAEFKSKMGESLKESGETKYWLLLFKQYGNKDQNLLPFLMKSIQLEKIFYSIYHS